LSYEATPGHSATNAYPSSSPAEPVKVEDVSRVTPAEDMKPKKKSLRQNRNALLNSLPNYSTESDAECDDKNESKTSSPVQDNNRTNTIYDHFKSRTKTPSSTHGGINLDNIMCVRKTDFSFELRDEDFPPL
jgi:hypothetical protein